MSPSFGTDVGSTSQTARSPVTKSDRPIGPTNLSPPGGNLERVWRSEAGPSAECGRAFGSDAVGLDVGMRVGACSGCTVGVGRVGDLGLMCGTAGEQGLELRSDIALERPPRTRPDE